MPSTSKIEIAPSKNKCPFNQKFNQKSKINSNTIEKINQTQPPPPKFKLNTKLIKKTGVLNLKPLPQFRF